MLCVVCCPFALLCLALSLSLSLSLSLRTLCCNIAIAHKFSLSNPNTQIFLISSSATIDFNPAELITTFNSLESVLQITPISQSTPSTNAILSPEFTLEMFVAMDLKVHNDVAAFALHYAFPLQCKTCGLRMPTQEANGFFESMLD